MICLAFGNRPDYLKFLPLMKCWKDHNIVDYYIYLTGQHEELCNSLKEELQEYSSNIYMDKIQNTTNNRLDNLVISIMTSFSLFLENNPNISDIICLGDTASAFGCALAAFHRKIPIIHIEAGLRSYDNENPYPEEFYRRSISMMSSINFCPTQKNMVNLFAENAPGKCHVVGNTIIDPIKNIEPLFENKILVTMHRRENLSEIPFWFECIESLASEFKDYEFILPIHKNPEIYRLKSMFKYVKCVDPLSHDEFIEQLRRCKYVITDSGGVAEEATWFGKRIFLCRERTERPEGEQFYIWSKNTNELRRNFYEYMSFNLKSNLKVQCPFGDGNSSEKITSILIENGIIKV